MGSRIKHKLISNKYLSLYGMTVIRLARNMYLSRHWHADGAFACRFGREVRAA